MKNVFVITGLLIIAGFGFKTMNHNLYAAPVYSDTQYVCLPCGSDCDKTLYTKPGTCTHCNMPLVKKTTVKFKAIAPVALCNFIKNKGKENVVLLDVRTAAEFNGTAPDKFGKLAGAINIPIQELDKRIAELNPYKNKEIVVYCSHSHRSPRASYMLMQKGFTKVTNMELGMSEWTNSTTPSDCNNKLYVKQ